MKLKRILTKALGAAIVAMALTGCKTPQDVAYFQDVPQTDVIFQTVSQAPIKVEPHDDLSIIVSAKDPGLARLFNLNVTAKHNGVTADREELSLYTVSSQGTIDFPLLGELKVAGMTREEVAGFIKGELVAKELIKDPVVTVELYSAAFTILGEVGHAGRFSITRDQLTLIEGLAMAGDISLQGKRDNIIVMRRNGNEVETHRVDITNAKELMNSPAYYLKQGDVIYVEPNDQRKRQTRTNANNLMSISFWISVSSLLTSVALLFVK